MAEGRRRVHERFGVVLEPEVQMLGTVELAGGWELAAEPPGTRSPRGARPARPGAPGPAAAVMRARLAAARRRGARLLLAGWFWLRDSSLVAVRTVKVSGVPGAQGARDARRARARRRAA